MNSAATQLPRSHDHVWVLYEEIDTGSTSATADLRRVWRCKICGVRA